VCVRVCACMCVRVCAFARVCERERESVCECVCVHIAGEYAGGWVYTKF